jgi:hypothetical protein
MEGSVADPNQRGLLRSVLSHSFARKKAKGWGMELLMAIRHGVISGWCVLERFWRVVAFFGCCRFT